MVGFLKNSPRPEVVRLTAGGRGALSSRDVGLSSGDGRCGVDTSADQRFLLLGLVARVRERTLPTVTETEPAMRA